MVNSKLKVWYLITGKRWSIIAVADDRKETASKCSRCCHKRFAPFFNLFGGILLPV